MDGRNAENDLFVALKIISKIRTHERVSTRAGGIRVEPNTKLQCVRRWLDGETREHNIRTISGLVDTAFGMVRLRSANDTDEDAFTCRRICAALTEARTGILNLCTTYADCSKTVATLDHLADEIQLYVSNYETTS